MSLKTSATIKLTYFKPSGKWYTDGVFTSKLEYMYEIFDHVRDLRNTSKLPGLGSGSWDGYILVTSDDHPCAYPGLVLPPT